MAVVKFMWNDFKELYGGEITFDDLEKLSFDYGMEVEEKPDEDGEFGVNITPERPDMYSIEGYVRALSGFSEKTPGLHSQPTSQSDVELYVGPVIDEIRPYIGGAIIRDVTVDDQLLRSIIRFQEKLHLTLGRKRKKIAIGIYDMDKVVPPLHYNAVKPNEVSFVPLEMENELNLEEILEQHPMGQEYAHLLEDFRCYPILMDSKGNVLSFPPIINSNYSGKVTEDTRNLFVEVTGTHEPTLMRTLNMLATSISQRGGSLERITVKYQGRDYLSPELKEDLLQVERSFIEDYLGIELDDVTIEKYLSRMKYDVKTKDGVFHITSPSYRTDVISEVDVVEDIAIAHGYSNFSPRTPRIHTQGKGSVREDFSNYVRDICAQTGLAEVMTLTLSNTQDQYTRINLPIDVDYVSVLNSKSMGHDIARVRLLPELLKTLNYNKTQPTPMGIFEVEDTIVVDRTQFTQSRDIRKLAIAEMGAYSDFTRIRSLVAGVMEQLPVEYKITSSTTPYFFEGRRGDIYVGDLFVGSFGEIHPSVLGNFDLNLPVAAAEMNLDLIQQYVKSRI